MSAPTMWPQLRWLRHNSTKKSSSAAERAPGRKGPLSSQALVFDRLTYRALRFDPRNWRSPILMEDWALVPFANEIPEYIPRLRDRSSPVRQFDDRNNTGPIDDERRWLSLGRSNPWRSRSLPLSQTVPHR